MNNLERIKTVNGLVGSVQSSLETWDEIQKSGKIPAVGCNLNRSDSRNSIINRCMVARAELLNIMNALKES